MTETEKILRRIREDAAPGEREILAEYIKEWMAGEKRRLMLVGQR